MSTKIVLQKKQGLVKLEILNRNNMNYNIDRKKASALLNVSVRTIDRYISQNKLSHQRFGAKILLSEEEINKFRTIRGRKTTSTPSIKYETPRIRVDKIDNLGGRHVVNIEKLLESQGYEKAQTPILTNHSDEENVYKKLYEESMKELKENQKRLEGANYKVGQLEAKIESYAEHFIPIAEYHKETKLLKGVEIDMNSKYFNEKLVNKDMEMKIREEKFNKHVVMAILFSLLILQPIFWLILK